MIVWARRCAAANVFSWRALFYEPLSAAVGVGTTKDGPCDISDRECQRPHVRQVMNEVIDTRKQPMAVLSTNNPISVVVRCKALITNFGRLVLGCIEADLCKQMVLFILPHLSRSTMFMYLCSDPKDKSQKLIFFSTRV